MLARIPDIRLKGRRTDAKSVPNSDKALLTLNLTKQPIINLLTSDSEDERLKGLKILIAMHLSRKKITGFLPSVINIISHDLQIKRFIYFCLIQASSSNNSQILMSINSLHKDLIDAKPITRASALRALSSMTLDEITGILQMTMQRAVTDFSIYVRKAAALTIIKLNDWEDIDETFVIQNIERMLQDSNSTVLGVVLYAFSACIPERLDLLHGYYRKLCKSVEGMETFYIPNALNVLTRYARVYLHLQYIDQTARISQDLKMLLDAAEDLLGYDSPGVLISCAETLYHLAPVEKLSKPVMALLGFKHHKTELAFIMLCMLYEYAQKHPQLLSTVFNYFYLSPQDRLQVIFRELALKKLNILGQLVNEVNINTILKELYAYAHYENTDISVESVKMIGSCAQRMPKLADVCTKHLIMLLKAKMPMVTAQAIITLRRLISYNAEKYRKVIVHCARIVETLEYPQAKASAIWIIGKYYQFIPTLAIETFRRLILNFTKEVSLVKHQILNSIIKIYTEWTGDKEFLDKLIEHLLQLCLYDLSYDIRDKARVIQSALSHPLLQAPIFESTLEIKQIESNETPYVPISLSYLVQKKVEGYHLIWEQFNNPEYLLPFLQQDTSALRDEEVVQTVTIPESTHYSSDDMPKVSNYNPGRTRVILSDPSTLEQFLEEESEDEDEYEYYSESGEEDDNN